MVDQFKILVAFNWNVRGLVPRMSCLLLRCAAVAAAAAEKVPLGADAV